MPALLVDDSAVSRLLYKRCLEALGLTVVVAADGVEGLEAAARTKFRLVVTDLGMPKLGGLEMLTTLRTWENYRETKFVVVSALSAEQQRSTLRELGVSLWIIKPSEPDLFVKAIGKLLGIKPPAATKLQVG